MYRIKKQLVRLQINKDGLYSVVKNTRALLIIRILSYLIPLLVFPYLTRIFGLAGFGSYAISIAICALLLVVTDFGFAFAGVPWLAQHRHDKHKIAYYLANVVILKLILIIFCLLLLLAIILPQSVLFSLRGRIPAIIMLLISQTFLMEWLFQGIERISLALYPFIISRLFFLISVLLLVNSSQDIDLTLYLLATGNLLAVSINSYLLYRQGYYLATPNISQIIRLAKNNALFFFSNLALNLYSSLNTFMLAASSGMQTAGIYSAAEKLYLAAQALSSPLSQALAPYLARTGDKKLFYILIGLSAGVLFCICVTLSFFAPQIITLFYGQPFIDAADIFSLFLICILINFISVNFGYPAFSAIDRIRLVNNTVFIGIAVQFSGLSVLYFTGKLNALSVVKTTLISESLVLLLRLGLFFYLVRVKKVN